MRASVEAWSRGDREAYLGDVHPDWEFHTSGVFPGLKPVTVKVERVEDLGDRVVGLVHFSVRGRDGIETERDWAYVVSGRDGIPMRTENFATWAAALESVGLRE